MEFSNLVKIKRNKRNLTLSELEEKAGVSASFISRIENNTQKAPSAMNVFKLAKALNITLKELEACFGTKLKDYNEDGQIKLIKQTDYVLVKQGEDILSKIANNIGDYDDNVNKLLDVARKLRKDSVKVISSLSDVDYIVDLRVDDAYLVNKVKELLSDKLGGRIKVIKGVIIESDSEITFEIEEFIENLVENEFIEVEEADEIKGYLKKINY